MPTIQMRLSQTDYDLLGEDIRKDIGNRMRTLLAQLIDKEANQITTYWYPFPDAQNAAFIEAEIHYICEKETADRILEVFCNFLSRYNFPIVTNRDVGVWFPLMPGQPYLGGLIMPVHGPSY